MISLKHLAMPVVVPLAGSALALVLLAPGNADAPVNCRAAAAVESEVQFDSPRHDAGVNDVVDYPAPPPMEWTLGEQEPDDLEVPPSAQVEAEGLSWLILREGDDSQATPEHDAVARMRFVGWSADGQPLPGARALTMVPMDVPLDEMTAGFQMAARQMHPGERRRVWIPEELAWQGREGRPAGTIIYDMELVSWLER